MRLKDPYIPGNCKRILVYYYNLIVVAYVDGTSFDMHYFFSRAFPLNSKYRTFNSDNWFGGGQVVIII